MGMQITFDIEDRSTPVVVADGIAPMPGSEITLDGVDYEVVSVNLAFWTDTARSQRANVRLRKKPETYVPKRI